MSPLLTLHVLRGINVTRAVAGAEERRARLAWCGNLFTRTLSDARPGTLWKRRFPEMGCVLSIRYFTAILLLFRRNMGEQVFEGGGGRRGRGAVTGGLAILRESRVCPMYYSLYVLT